VRYWDDQSPDNEGVLGGFGRVSPADIMDSRRFLVKCFSERLQEAKETGEELVAADCGAGIGRVSKELLLQFFQQVDVVEPSEHLLETARRNLKTTSGGHRAVNFFRCGLEGFEPEGGRYDALWIQWALMYLTDEDAVAFLRRCKARMKAKGVIFLKENVCDRGFLVDSDDCSMTRSHAYFDELFRVAGLRLVHTAVQRNFPKCLFKVRMYCLSVDD
jgi:protein N-terminal methyltransferase